MKHPAALFMAFLTACCLLMSACTPPARLAITSKSAPPTTVYVVRHAEKELGSAPGLTEQGTARAEFYADFFAPTEITAVYSTPTRRTIETGTPLAKSKDQEVREYANALEFDTFSRQLLATHAGETIFIVGHSNTVPLLVNNLSGSKEHTDVPHDEYRRLYQIIVQADGTASVRLFEVP